jgi:hypothetical protein
MNFGISLFGEVAYQAVQVPAPIRWTVEPLGPGLVA